MNIKKTLSLEVGTKLKCVQGFASSFTEGDEYEVIGFNSEGLPLVRNDYPSGHSTATQITHNELLVVGFIDGYATFEVINNADEAAPVELKEGDVLKCIHTSAPFFTQDVEYTLSKGITSQLIVRDNDEDGINIIVRDNGEIWTAGESAKFERVTDSKTEYEYKIGEILTCVESDKPWFKVGKGYEVDRLTIGKRGVEYLRVVEENGIGIGFDAHGDYCCKGSVKLVKSSALLPQGSELTKKLLEKQSHQVCWCADSSDEAARDVKTLCLVTGFIPEINSFKVLGRNGQSTWRHAVPIDNNHNEIIEISASCVE